MAITRIITPAVTDANITTAKVTDNAITLAKMASGTDGNIISYDASGNPVAIATGSDGQVLTSTGAGSPPAFEALPGGGKIGQVSYNRQSLTFSTTSASFVDSGHVSTAITPAATSSKMAVFFSGNFNKRGTAGNFMVTCYRVIGGTAQQLVGGRGLISSDGQASASHLMQYGWNIVDSPNTTSAVTYKAYIMTEGGNGTIHMSYDSGTTSGAFVVMEILA